MFVQQQSPATRPTCSKMQVHDPKTENSTGISQSQTKEICLAKTMRRPWYTLGHNSAKQCFMKWFGITPGIIYPTQIQKKRIRHFCCLPTIRQGIYHEIFGLTSTPPNLHGKTADSPKKNLPTWVEEWRFPIPKSVFWSLKGAMWQWVSFTKCFFDLFLRTSESLWCWIMDCNMLWICRPKSQWWIEVMTPAKYGFWYVWFFESHSCFLSDGSRISSTNVSHDEVSLH